jgi:hypothetical protein
VSPREWMLCHEPEKNQATLDWYAEAFSPKPI